MAAKKISVKTIMLTLGAALLLCVLAVLGLAWQSMSYDIAAAPAPQEETFTLRFDDFSIDVPKSFGLDRLSISLNWPGARILMNEAWFPDNEKALKGFEEAKQVLLDKHGEVIDLSGELGFPARLVPRIEPIDLPEKPIMMIGVVRENVQLNFLLMLAEPPIDPEAWKAALISRVRDFAALYQPLAHPGMPTETDGSMVRARHGMVSPGPRAGYAVSPNYVHLIRGGQSFYINTTARSERFVERPGFNGKITRFFKNLSRTGVLSGLGLRERRLDAVPGHEILIQHPYWGQKLKIYDFNWQQAPQTPYGKWISLVAPELSPAEASALYGEWQQILQSVRFNKQ